jgi:chromosome segregation ATPase
MTDLGTRMATIEARQLADRHMLQQILDSTTGHQKRHDDIDVELKSLNGRLDRVDQTLADHSKQLDAISDTLHDHTKQLHDLNRKVDKRFEDIDARFDAMERQFDDRFTAVDGKLDAIFELLRPKRSADA